MVELIERGPEDKGKFVTQDVTATVEIRDPFDEIEKEYGLTELETEETKFNQADIATATVVPKERDYYLPSFEDEITITINGVPTYTGYVGEITENEDGTFELKCFNTTRRLKQTSLNIGTEEQFVLASDILRNKVMPEVGISDYNIMLDHPIAEGIEIATDTATEMSIHGPKSFDIPVKFDEGNKVAMSVVDMLAKSTNSVWWVDGSGTFNFGQPPTETYKISYVKDASAGKTTPPYQSVKVIGGGMASQENWMKSTLISANPVIAVRGLENMTVDGDQEAQESAEGDGFNPVDDALENMDDAYRIIFGDLREPTFEYKDKSIQTQQEADAIANALVTELIRQTQQGWVEIVGWANISPFDVIEMPDSMGGEQYLVQGVKHTLDNSNGFTTRIECGGFVGGGI